jgi:tetratricopeptide (TPR) repeat protein
MSAQEREKILEHQAVVFTGRLASFSRREAQELVVNAGGAAPPRLTKAATMLVMGEEGYLNDLVKSNKLMRAESINAEGGNIRIIPESEFLAMLGFESKAALERKYYSVERVQQVYPRLRDDVIRYLAYWGIFKPAVKTNAHQYYEFKDLLVFRQIDGMLAQKLQLRMIAKHLLAQRQPSPQTQLNFEEHQPKGLVLSLQPRPPAEPPRSAEEWYEIGFQADGNPETYDRAIAAYENALAMSPDYVDAMINLANIYFHKREVPRSIQLLEKARQLDENNYLVCYNLANLYDEAGHFEQAVSLYQNALKLFPNYEPALFNLAVVHEKLGRRAEAKGWWKKYLEVEPEGEWAQIAQEHLAEANS